MNVLSNLYTRMQPFNNTPLPTPRPTTNPFPTPASPRHRLSTTPSPENIPADHTPCPPPSNNHKNKTKFKDYTTSPTPPQATPPATQPASSPDNTSPTPPPAPSHWYHTPQRPGQTIPTPAPARRALLWGTTVLPRGGVRIWRGRRTTKMRRRMPSF